MFFGFVFMLAVALYLLFSPVCLWAAPFAKYFQFTQPDGVRLTLWGEGDEFHAIFETTTGYTVVFDPEQKAYFYAERAADGKSLISSGVFAHEPAPPGLAQHVRMDHDAVVAVARARRKQWDAETGLSERWSRLKSQTLGTPLSPDEVGVLPLPPAVPTIGTKIGLTLLVDFPDDPATISQTEIEDLLNSDSYTGFGNNGSVKNYFYDVSGSRLTYTNVVTIYVRMTQPKSYYDDTSKDSGTQHRLLINDALAILMARSDYNSTILPTFSALTTDGSGYVVAFNVFYAGTTSSAWGYGLWPATGGVGPVPLGNGKSVYIYQISDIFTSPGIGTFCHENGHMLCGFPDIYDYDFDSMGGAASFSLMGFGNNPTNPSQVDAYLKLAAGWATVTDLDGTSNLIGTLVAAPNSGYDHFYRYRRPGVATEYFLLENRQKTGRDAILPAAGIAVWHVDELGDKDNQSMVPNSTHLNYELTLVQADNQWHFQNNVNVGDAFDLYYQGNSAALYTNRLDDSSAPNTHWWDGTTSGMNLNGFSVAGTSMTFNICSTQESCSGMISFDSANYSVNENGGGSVLVTVTRTGASMGAVGVSYAASNGTATAGPDYTAASGTLSWANGDTANKTFSVPITSDALNESNETFTVTLSSPTGGATLGSPSSSTVTITDDDPAPTVEFSAASSSGSEATTPASIGVTLSAPSGQTATVNYAMADVTATAGSDYTATSGTLTFNPGVTSQTISVPIINDTAVEGDETFTVTLSGPVNATLGATTTHTYAIINDDNAGTLQFSSATYGVNENGGSVLISVARTGGSTGTVGVSYATSNGTAAAVSDYTFTSGTLSWTNGDTANKTFSVPITNDTLDEANETFTVTLSSPTGGATLGSPSSATVTITDDDPTPTVQFSAASSSGSEATTPALMTVTLSAVSGQTVTVSYATANVTATAGSDYTATSGTLTFNPGVTNQTISVPIINDTAVEDNETFTVTLSGQCDPGGDNYTHLYDQ
jgi:M6 family metalloprotease-like protein